MNKLLIVGHPHSGHQEIERMLAAAGMATARPSKREGLMPAPLNALLCGAHGVPAAEDAAEDAGLHQIAVSPVWNGLALDLMLANVDQPLWGWSDPAAVRLLQFWHDIDPSIHFVLVYDTPGQLLAAACQAFEPPDEWPQVEPMLAKYMREWMHYHEALLQFYLRHAGRCWLVQRRQVQDSPAGLLVRLQDRIPLPWTGERHAVAQAVALANDTDPSPLATWIADAMAHHFPAARQLYEELQLVASLPRTESHATDPHGIWNAWSDLVAQARRSHVQRQEIAVQCTQIGHLQIQLHVVEQLAATTQAASAQQLARLSQAARVADTDHQRLLDKLQQIERIARKRQHRLQRLDQQACALQKDLERSQAHTAAVEQDREHWLVQLRQVQEALEQQYASQQELSERLAQLQHAEQLAQERQHRIDHLDQQASALRNDLERAQAHTAEQARNTAAVAQRLRTVEQDREHLLVQLQQVQETLERQHASQQELSERLAQLQHAEQLAQERQHRIDHLDQQAIQRQHDLARSQAHAAEQARDSTALLQRLHTVEQEREHLLGQLQQVQEALAHQHMCQQELAQQLEQLPRVEQLARERQQRIAQLDQRTSEQFHDIERLERHTVALQNQLQERATAHQSLTEDHTRLVAQLHHVQQVLERQHHAHQQSPAPAPAPAPTQVHNPAAPPTEDTTPIALFGAADRVKAQLSYRLGATLIQHSRSLGGWLRMPFAVLTTLTQFQREKPQRQAHKLPPIHQYRDAHEAERIRGHLSYRLGAVMVRHAASPLGWGRMPFALQREIRAFRMRARA